MAIKKKLTFPLLVIVLALWGAIFYRIVSGLEPDTAPTPVPKLGAPSGKTIKRPIDDNLLLNYGDPFLSGISEVTETDHVDTLMMDEGYVEETPYVDWSQIQYLGSVNNSESGEAIALVVINGKEYMLTAGETVDGYTLLRQGGASISVGYLGQETTIAMQSTDEMQFQ